MSAWAGSSFPFLGGICWGLLSNRLLSRSGRSMARLRHESHRPLHTSSFLSWGLKKKNFVLNAIWGGKNKHANQVEFPLITPISVSRNVGVTQLRPQAGAIRGWVASPPACPRLGASSQRGSPALFRVGLLARRALPACVRSFCDSSQDIPGPALPSANAGRQRVRAIPKGHS